ncbi:MAG: glutaredoxin [Polyangiaceae bacterium]|nr:glutaredoxin [Myxococcales bacterium]MCB9587424.1 glutaredoxin [Polyangiaceae bacterium]MCB9605779.1 glutaredoxin [Polyangiaceae bacterium]
MQREILEEDKIHPGIREKIATNHHDIVEEVKAAIAKHRLVVVGMAQNPFPRKARALLKSKGVNFHYMEYGSYLKEWRRRNALKMWTGWPTFPMVFIKGTLVGGFEDLKKLEESGDLAKMLD